MSVCSVRPGPVPGVGDLRPFAPASASSAACLPGSAPAPRFVLCYVTPSHFCPRFLPVFANFRGSRLPPARSPVSSGSKKQKISLPRRRAAQTVAPPGQKTFIHAEKPLCIVHNGFFLFVWKCFLVFFHAQILQRPASCIIFRHEFPAPLLHNL